MNLADTLRSFVRRWYIVIPALILAAVVGLTLWDRIPPSYERSASQILLPAPSAIPEDANPFLYLSGLTQAADVLIRSVSSDSVVSKLTDGYSGVDVQLSRDSSTGAPVVVTTVTAERDSDAAAILDEFLDEAEIRLDRIQSTAGVVADDRITIKTLTIDEQSQVGVKNRLTFTVAATVSVVVLGLVLAALLDSIILARARRPHRGQVSEDEIEASGAEHDGHAGDDDDEPRSEQADALPDEAAWELVAAPSTPSQSKGDDSDFGSNPLADGPTDRKQDPGMKTLRRAPSAGTRPVDSSEDDHAGVKTPLG